MSRIIKYIKFLISSTNRHGIHSPFIYNYITKGLHIKKGVKNPKSVNILLKTIRYFCVHNMCIDPEATALKNRLVAEFANLKFDVAPYDLIVMDTDHFEHEFTQLTNLLYNDSILFLDAIHHSDKNSAIWKRVKNHKRVTVTVDMFHCGVAFFRKEQAEEHFRIRV